MGILKKHCGQKGAFMVLFVIILPFVFAMMGLAIDFGIVYVQKTKLQNTADAAALTGAVHLKETADPYYYDYVKRMLTANDFVASDGSSTGGGEPTSAQNWKTTLLKATVGNDNQVTVTTVTDPLEANRLRVTILQPVELTFLPLFSELFKSVNITVTATAREGTSGTAVQTDKFFIKTLGTLTLEKNVHIPSYPADKKGDNINYADLYGYNDYGEYLSGNIYAADIKMQTAATLRVSGKILSDNQNIHTELLDKQIFLTNKDNYERIQGSKDYNYGQMKKSIETVADEGRNIYNDYKAGKIKAIYIDVKLAADETFNFNDYQMANIRKNLMLKPDYQEYFKSAMDAEVRLPIIIDNSKGNNFQVDVAISYFVFRQPIIVVGGNISITGNGFPYQSNSWASSVAKNVVFSGLYCYKKDSGGSIFTTSGSCSDKDFAGNIYADTGITISAVKNCRRHIFRSALVSPANITFGADGNGSKGATHRFESTKVTVRPVLVE